MTRNMVRVILRFRYLSRVKSKSRDEKVDSATIKDSNKIKGKRL